MTGHAGAAYGADYYQHYSPRRYERDEYWLRVFRVVADRIVERINPRHVLDAGCALGILVEALRDRGVDAHGIDLSEFAIAHAHESVKPYCRVASVSGELPSTYDLIVCIEVLEHLPADEAARAVANFCRHADDVLFSSTPMHFRDTSHLNVQPPEYWAERFAEHGLFRDVDFDASFVSPWAVRFRRSRDPLPRIVAGYERRFARLAQERNELRTLAGELEEQDRVSRARARDLEQLAAGAERTSAQAALDLDAARAQAAALDTDLTRARSTIANMERSLFWRAREVWVALRRALGGRS